MILSMFLSCGRMARKQNQTVVSNERTTGNVLGLKYKIFHLNTRKNLLTLGVTEHWRELPRNLRESPSLGTIIP